MVFNLKTKIIFSYIFIFAMLFNILAGFTSIGTVYAATESAKVIAFATGSNHSLALKDDGTVWAWGQNIASSIMTTPMQITELSNIIAIAAGNNHSLALNSNGTVWAWGVNDQGQLGDGTTVTPKLTPFQIPGLTEVKAIAAGDKFSMALKQDGTLWAWGNNGNGQLGNGNTTRQTFPVQVLQGQSVSVSGDVYLDNVSAITAGKSHAVAIRNDKTAWAWGQNNNGQLGNGTTTGATTPVQVSGLTEVNTITSKGEHTVAVKADGTLWAWGKNDKGQLGPITGTDNKIPNQINITDVKTIAAGNNHTLALKNDGTLWAWGDRGDQGRLGDGLVDKSSTSTPVQVLKGESTSIDAYIQQVVMVSPGDKHNLVLRQDGTVWSWGDNTNGQLGNGSQTSSSTAIMSSLVIPILGDGSDTTPPVVINVTPGDKSTNVSASSSIEVSFNEELTSNFVNASLISLKDIDGASIGFDTSILGNALFIFPKSELIYSMEYTLNISPGAVRDLAGNLLVDQSVSTFITGAMPTNWNELDWNRINSGLGGLEVRSMIVTNDAQRYILGTKDGKIFSLDKNHGSWRLRSTLGQQITALKAVPNSETIYAFGNNVFYQSLDNGLTWQSAGELPIGSKREFENALIVDENSIYLAMKDLGFFYTTDKGVTWTNISGNLPAESTGQIKARAIELKDGVLYAGVHKQGIYSSNDQGLNWQPLKNMEGLSSVARAELRSIFINGSDLYIGTKDGVWKTSETSNVWEKVEGIPVDEEVRFIFKKGTSLYAITKIEMGGNIYEAPLAQLQFELLESRPANFQIDDIWGAGLDGDFAVLGDKIGALRVKLTPKEVQVLPISVEKVELNKASSILNVGETETLIATVNPENASNKEVSWESSEPNVAIVSPDGIVTAVGPGNATITATTIDGSHKATCNVTVNTPVTGVSLNKTSTTLIVGATDSLAATVTPTNATNKEVTWNSNKTSVATVSANGVVTAVGAGNATITVTTVDGLHKATCNITVTIPITKVTGVSLNKSSTTLNAGATENLTATVTPTNATNKGVTWNSNNSNVATVNASGVITAVGPGTATITVTTVDGSNKASCTVTVKQPVKGIKLNKTILSLNVGARENLTATVTPSNATNKEVTWSSSNAKVATVDQKGVVTAKEVGTATITVTTKDGSYKASCTVIVKMPVKGIKLNKTSLTLKVKAKGTLTATVTPTNATNKGVTWSSSNTKVATIDSKGVVTAKGTGTVTITATTKDGSYKATCKVTVKKK